ncbi:hypothetical protein JHK82_038635 [Glycine max]|uniref:UBZ4-type domain-containing protein n=3 Tax=Glycine subgen. Soja TaxID=1462606 RepID=K7M4L6_SOYBN|nr:uncharacterized protein LOC100800669 isoform X1 [Glycine max]XP_028199076.1 uncharacterized protein LOC114383579 [Glycine soja]KAG4382191.1 hypothetical protein GLYMA_14G026900v4 [Glycine max]KAG5109412.1 hypothetical protein JHK82_038635 [Glycine max]KAH1092830.1 hypothetical protein GYH30_038842 [Glycine max]KAH1092831.1 hypothetical protein GYH30_038842 [Glycine max]KAH1211491.1 hypothetical protein GmHk_14G039925 [Glycine max]|eukprot:XP_006595746.1 uncharacterized protein LOC100800669 [Glycine max]
MVAATFDGFSIRDYTSKMRSIDVFKCWPFASTSSRDVSDEEVQSWLPPMNPCPRSDDSTDHRAQNLEIPPSAAETDEDDGDVDCSEEESAESMESEKSAPPSDSSPANNNNNNEDEKLEMVCPVCREFNAATLTAVNAHIDGCLAQTMREERRHMRIMNLKSSSSKSKPSKPLKKRSIAEIFMVEEQPHLPQPQPQPQLPPQIESVLKFWPFREGKVDDVSITVTKFEWLSRRLEALRSTRVDGESAKSDQGDISEEKMEMLCPVCRDFNAATVTAVNAHIDGCLAQAVREERRQMRRSTGNCKPIPKTPKKRSRSIAEILTVAPPIEAGKRKAIQVEEEDEEKSDYGYSGGDSTRAATPAPSAAVATPVASVIKNKKSTMKNRNKKKLMKVKKKKSKVEKHGDSGVWFVNNEKKTVASKKKKKKKKNVFNNRPTGNKVDVYERMVQSAVNSSRKLKGTIDNKMLPLHEVDPSIDRKISGINCLSVEKKQQVKNCDSVGKQEKAVSPNHGILKNRFKHVSEKTSSGSSIGDGTQESYYSDQEETSDRHVKFSGKDDIPGPKKTNSFDETLFKISSDAVASSAVKEKSSGSDEETASLEPNRNYDHIDRGKREVCPIVESKQFSNTLDQDTIQSFLKPCINQEKSKLLEEKSELLTKVAVCDNNDSQFFYGGNRTTLHCSPYADISRPLSAVQVEKMSGINTKVCESGSFSYSGKLDHLDDPQVDAVNSNENTKTFLEPSSSYSASYNANEKPESPLQTYGDKDNSGEALGNRQFSRMFSADMIDNSFPNTGWEKGSGKNSCLDPDFFGLPLNSHGELINFSSSGNLGMNQSDTSSTLRGSFSGLPINNILHQSSQENLSINENHVVQKTFPKDGLDPFPHHPTRLPVTELQSREREDIHRPNSSDMCSSHYVPPLNSELNCKKNSFVEQNQCDRVWNHNGNGVVSLKEGSHHISPSSSQPTMRLMGKDVPIGRSSQEMQQFAGDVWPDEESRRRNYSEYAALDHSLLERSSKQDWVSGSPLQISADNVLQAAKIQNNQAAQGTILMSSTDSGFSQQFIDRQSNHGVNRNASSYFNPITQKSTSYAAFNGASNDFSEQFIPGAKPLGLSSQLVVLPTPGNFSHSTHVTNGELNDRNKNPHVTKSAFGFPFLQPTVNEQAKTSWYSPYRSSPSWLSISTDEMLPGTFSRQFSASSSQNFPQNLWGNNFTTPFVNHSAEVRFPSNHLTSSLGPMQTTPLSRVSIGHPLHVPVTPSTINSDNININKVADRLKFDDHQLCTNTRKRPAAAANLDDSRKPTKLLNMRVQENFSRMTRLPGEKSSVELQRNTRTLELDPHMGSARSRCCQHEAQNLNPGSYPAVNSFKLDGMVTSGPVRLGPKRAKHILNSS